MRSGKEVLVRTPARIHVGILDLRGDLGRLYGSVGLAIEEPYTQVRLREGDMTYVEGDDDERAMRYAMRFLNKMELDRGFKISVERAIPIHMGLGSGTQLALAIGVGLSKLYGLDLSTLDIATIMGRGSVSGAGVYSFMHGGFVVDAGRRVDREGFPPLIFRLDFPEEWKVVVCLPNIERGFSGEEEKRAMSEAVESCKDKEVSRASRILLMKMLPALIDRDVREFGESLLLFEKAVGRMFMDVQTGIFRDEVIERGIELMIEEGAYGAGQSSWGPAFYGIVDEDKAYDLASALRRYLDSNVGGEVLVTRANNEGARIEVIQVS